MTARCKSLPDLCPDLPDVSRGSLELAIDYVADEHEKLLALAMTLRQRLEPANPKDPTGGDDLTAWRLAELLEERLTSTDFTNTLRVFVLGEKAAKSA